MEFHRDRVKKLRIYAVKNRDFSVFEGDSTERVKVFVYDNF